MKAYNCRSNFNMSKKYFIKFIIKIAKRKIYFKCISGTFLGKGNIMHYVMLYMKEICY